MSSLSRGLVDFQPYHPLIYEPTITPSAILISIFRLPGLLPLPITTGLAEYFLTNPTNSGSGVSLIALENPEVVGYLRYYWIRNGDRGSQNYNYKVSIFRNRVIETISYKAPLYSIDVAYIDPKGTTSSKEHGKAMKKHGLDRHTASAYLIALKGIERRKPIQKATL
ncbi:hypothetical protein [Desulfurococcus sp.]|uniref:hypothetical protein n=1 Tax=Desulfurococcus sp. TaxID=51678 RepID=UPI00403FF28A